MARSLSLWSGLGVSAILLGVYVWTLSPSVAVGDSGELITAAATMGIAHPPGYPLWCLVMRLFAMIPLASPAFMVNLGTAFFAAISGWLFHRLATGSAGLPVRIAFPLTLVHGLSPALWSQAVVAEVYTFNLAVFLSVALLHLEGGRRLRLLPYASGLALATHGTSWSVLAPIALERLRAVFRVGLSRRRLVGVAFGVLLGLTPVLYLPLRARLTPFLDWGHPADLDGLLVHLTRGQYGGFRWPGPDVGIDLVGRWMAAATAGGSILIWPLGAWSLIRHGVSAAVRTWLAWIVLSGPIMALLLAGLLRGEQLIEPEVFWLPSFSFLLLLAGRAVHALPRRAPSIGAAVILLWAIWLLVDGRGSVGKAGNTIAPDYADAILATLPAEAVLCVVADHEAFPIMYAQGVEKRRRDITVRTAGPPADRDVYGHPAPPLATVVRGGVRPIFVTVPRPPFDPDRCAPHGLVFELDGERPRWWPVRLGYHAGHRLSHHERLALASVGFHEAAYRYAVGEPEVADRLVALAEATAFDNAALLNDLATLVARNGSPAMAGKLWRRAVSVDPRLLPAWQNLLILAMERGDRLEAQSTLDAALERNPGAPALEELARAYGLVPGRRPGELP